jgi:hypothetical protein
VDGCDGVNNSSDEINRLEDWRMEEQLKLEEVK